MSNLPNCPKCNSEYTYEDGGLFICPECAYEWTASEQAAAEEAKIIRDSNGVELADGDTVTVIKDLNVKGASKPIKVGTKIKSIRLNYESDHDIDCKIEGFGAMGVKSIYVRKV